MDEKETAPSPFNQTNPRLQTAWDATSLGTLMFCPRRYQYSIIEGWRSTGVDVEFGRFAHLGFEAYDKARLAGMTRDEAQIAALRVTLEASWGWGGSFHFQWRCKGDKPYRNAKGNRAKCPWSHAGKWFDTTPPSVCSCGSEIEVLENWVPVDKYKDRLNLLRLVGWWCDEQPEDMADGLVPVALADGTPALELNFRMPTPWKAPDGEPYILAGYLDGIYKFGEEHFVVDHKTTGKGLTRRFFDGFSPDIQVDLYDLVGSLLFQGLNLRGVIIDAAQLLIGGVRFGRGINYRTEAQREELLAELEWWIRQAERYAEEGYWPMNRRNCWLCPFKGVCSESPENRARALAAQFEKRHWNPLEDR